jgi:hypothetical protein
MNAAASVGFIPALVSFILLKASVFSRHEDGEPFGSLFCKVAGDEVASLIVPVEVVEQVKGLAGYQFTIMGVVEQALDEDKKTPLVSEETGKLIYNIRPGLGAELECLGRPSVSKTVRGLPQPVKPGA